MQVEGVPSPEKTKMVKSEHKELPGVKFRSLDFTVKTLGTYKGLQGRFLEEGSNTEHGARTDAPAVPFVVWGLDIQSMVTWSFQ